MNRKQRRFVAEYLKDQNGTKAAIRAGYSKKTANRIASHLLTKVDIKAAINEKLSKIEEESGITVEYILNGLKEVAERCLQRVPVMVRDPRDGRKMIQKKDLDTDEGVWEFDSAGANRAFELLGKYKKMFTDKVEHSGTLSLEQILGASNQ